MNHTVIPVSNTPIFDQLRKEFANRGKHYEQIVARPVLVNHWPKSVEGVRPTVEIVDEVQETLNAGMTSAEALYNAELIARALNDTRMITPRVNDDGATPPVPLWAREGRRGVDIRKRTRGNQGGVIVLERDVHEPQENETLLYQDNVHMLDLANMGHTLDTYLARMVRQLKAENAGNEPKSIQVHDELDGTTTFTIRGIKHETSSIGENGADRLYMKFSGNRIHDEE